MLILPILSFEQGDDKEIHLLISPSKNLRWLLLFRRKHVRTSVYAQNPVRQVGTCDRLSSAAEMAMKSAQKLVQVQPWCTSARSYSKTIWQRTMNSLHLQLFDIL